MGYPGETQSAVPEIGLSSVQDSSGTPAVSTTPAGSAPGRDRSPKGRSRLLAALLSFLWPGVGQLYARRRITAIVFAIPVVLAAVWLVLQLTNGLDWFVASFLDDSFALTFVIGGALFAAWRIVAMIHAYATAGPRRRPGVLDSGVLAILLLVVVAVHAEVVYYSWSAYRFDVDVTNNVLVDNQPTSTSTPQPTATPSPMQWQPGGSYSPPNATPEVTASPEPTHRITILLTGLDFLAGRGHSMNDAIMLVSLDTATNKVAMISIPRDTSYFDYYWGGTTGVNTKINNFANLVADHKIPAPDPPLTALSKEIGFLVGVKVDYYAAIDMGGFASMVNMLPGHNVCVWNSKAINDPSTHTYIARGNVCLDGPTALKYVRSRHNGGNDYVRAGRQQDVLVAVARKLATAGGIRALPGLLSLGSKLIQTNFPLKTVRNYVSIVQHLGAGDITQCVLGPPYNYHPAAALTRGAWTSRLKLNRVAALSIQLFGSDSRYYGMEGIAPAPCGK
jgi:LCP family protein required for cell wall assembly